MKRGSAGNRRLDRWAGIPALWLLARLRRRGTLPAREAVRRVGVLTSTTIGDTLLASAAMAELRQLWPGAAILFFATRGNRGAAAMLPAVDEVVEISLTRPDRAVPAMRQQRLDILLDFSGWQRITALLALQSGARFVAGFSRGRQFRHSGFDFVAEHRGDRHESDNFAALTAALAAQMHIALQREQPALRPEIFSPAIDDCWRGAVVFHCWASGANRALREWPADQWVELATRLRQKWPGMHLVLTAGPDDMERARALSPLVNGEVFHAPGGLRAVATLLRAARLVVSVNTGTMHLAAVCGAPTVGINGPNAGRRWGPRGANAVGVDAPGEGCGYLDLGWEWWRDPSFQGQPSCMERTGVDAVMAAVEALTGAR